MTERARVNIFVSGLVQGVFFRASTSQKAKKLGLTGWVRNTVDGRVEIIAEGKKEKIQELLKWAEKGSSFSRVENLEVEWEEPKDDFTSFEIKK